MTNTRLLVAIVVLLILLLIAVVVPGPFARCVSVFECSPTWWPFYP